MPFYRFNGGMVHMKGTKLPKPCAAKVGIGERLEYCMEMSTFLCDGNAGGGHTCDRALCEAHANQIGPNKHLCPECYGDHIDSQAHQRSLFTSLV